MSKEIINTTIDFLKSIPKEAGNAYKTKRKYDYKEKSLPYDKGLIALGSILLYKIADKIADKDMIQMKGKIPNVEFSIKGKTNNKPK